MYERLGKFTHEHRWAVIAAWLLAAALLRAAAPAWSDVALDGDLDQLPPDTTTYRATRLNEAAFPHDRTKSQLVVVFAREGEALTPADRQFALATARELEAAAGLPLVDRVWTTETPIIGPTMASPAGHAERIVARLTNDIMAADNIRVLAEVERLIDSRRAAAPAGLEIGVTGSAAVGGDMLRASKESLRNTDRTTIVLVAAALALIYRSVWLIAVPLAAIGVAALVSLDLLALLAGWTRARPESWLDVRVFTTTRIFVVVLLFGAGTDFCLFLIARFRELRAAGASQGEAVAAAVKNVGGAITASAATTIVGLAMMAFADFGKFAYSGPAIAVGLSVALAVCLTLAPALLATGLGRHVSIGVATTHEPWSPFWTRLTDGILRWPAALMAASVVLAAPLAWRGAHTRVTYDIFSELSPGTTSRRGTALLSKHFPPGENGPLTVLASLPHGDLGSDDGRFKIAELNKRLYDLEGVDKVRSLYRPMGEAPGEVSFSLQGFSSLVAASSPLAKETFVSRKPGEDVDVTRLFVVLKDEPFSTAAVDTVERIERALREVRADRDSAWHVATFELLGVTSGVRDLERVTLADRSRLQWLVAAAVLAVILVLLRRPVVCLYLICTVLASYFVTLGLVDLVFGAIDGASYAGLDWKVPLFLFVILVAVGQDYNIYLVTRVFEEQRRHGPQEGLRRAMVQTGGIITSCGVIMAATFASMIAGSLRGMVELGVALSLGILLDTFVVRTALVPAFLALLARRSSTHV
jgi:RND superfamily putative drug exporter